MNDGGAYHPAVRATLERELKLDVDGSFALPALPGSPLPERIFTSTYHDTPARSLGRAGITLRRRVENGSSLWQLKLPRAGAKTDRTEIEEAGGPSGPPPELARLLFAHVRHGRLEPVATLRTRRSGVRVEEDGRAVADVTVDEVTILYAEHGVEGFTELEVELVDGGDEPDLRRLGRVLRDAGARDGSGAPKLMRVLELPSRSRPKRSAPLHVQLAHTLEEQLAELEAHDPGVRLGTDPEDLHQLRVATRRTRALIRATRPLLGDRLAVLGEELRLLGALLGAVRDLDVLLEHLEQEVETLGDDRPGGEALLAVARDRTRDPTRRARRRDGDASATRRCSTSSVTRSTGSGRSRETTPRLSSRSARSDPCGAPPRLFRLTRRMTNCTPLRIDAKRARYAAELAALDGSKSAVRAVGALKVLQDVIGVHQDAVVAEERLRRIASPETAVAAGRLIERERSRKAEMRARYPDALRDALREGRKAFS